MTFKDNGFHDNFFNMLQILKFFFFYCRKLLEFMVISLQQFLNPLKGNLSICFYSFIFRGKKKRKRIAIKFQNVVKLHRFILFTKNYHHVVHIVFTGTHQRFKHAITRLNTGRGISNKHLFF